MSRFFSYLLWCIIYAASLLPLRVHYFFSDILAFLLRKVIRYRVSTVYINLSRCFPNLKYGELSKLVKEYYIYMCDIMLESIWSVSASQKQLCKMVTVRNPEMMDALCAKHDKVMVVLGHKGNWELIGAFCGESAKRSPVSFANNHIMLGYKASENEISNLLFKRMRMHEYKKFKNKGHLVESNTILRDVVRTKEKSIFLFIADQSPLVARTVVKFLNQPTLMFNGPEFIARKLNLPVVYLDMERIHRGKYEITFSLITEAASSVEKGAIIREYARLLEWNIYMNKYNWLWSHKRWKRDLTPQEEEEYRSLYHS